MGHAYQKSNNSSIIFTMEHSHLSTKFNKDNTQAAIDILTESVGLSCFNLLYSKEGKPYFIVKDTPYMIGIINPILDTTFQSFYYLIEQSSVVYTRWPDGEEIFVGSLQESNQQQFESSTDGFKNPRDNTYFIIQT